MLLPLAAALVPHTDLGRRTLPVELAEPGLALRILIAVIAVLDQAYADPIGTDIHTLKLERIEATIVRRPTLTSCVLACTRDAGELLCADLTRRARSTRAATTIRTAFLTITVRMADRRNARAVFARFTTVTMASRTSTVIRTTLPAMTVGSASATATTAAAVAGAGARRTLDGLAAVVRAGLTALVAASDFDGIGHALWAVTALAGVLTVPVTAGTAPLRLPVRDTRRLRVTADPPVAEPTAAFAAGVALVVNLLAAATTATRSATGTVVARNSVTTGTGVAARAANGQAVATTA
jgi:hypothetical protein